VTLVRTIPVAALALASIFVSNVRAAFAQTTVVSPNAPAPAGGASPSAPAPPGQGAQAGPQGGAPPVVPQPAAPSYTGFVAPTPAGQPLGGGNATESSARARQGDDEDTFDLAPRAGGGGTTAYGDEDGPVFLDRGRPSARLGGVPPPFVHVVEKGDTLWDICDATFDNPYQWPRVWSYNPQLQNPHWIYPGDRIRLRPQGTAVVADPRGAPRRGEQAPGPIVDRRGGVPVDTVFLRDEGFIDDTSDENWGEISGAAVDKMFLSDFDEVYVRLSGTRDVKLGQELTVFRPVRNVPGGKLVQIQGTVRVDDWNPKERIARGQIVETVDVIERGSRIGPLSRRFTIVPPQRNAAEVVAHVVASIQPHTFYGQNQVVYIDKGDKDGLVLGNRLFVVRKGDAWRRSLPTAGAATRIAIESDSPAAIERVPTPSDPKTLPEEVIGELRVVALRDHSATCMVTQSRSEIEPNEPVVARKGY